MKKILVNMVKASLGFWLFYVFLAICNWEIWIGEWNGFSRFILAVILVGFTLWVINESNDEPAKL